MIWKLPIEHVENAWYTNYLVDAHSGEIVKEVQWTIECDHGSGSCEKSGDGHFHHTTGTVNFLSRTGRIPEMIVVGIPNTTDRTRDLTPPITEVDKNSLGPVALFRRFFFEIIIRTTVRTQIK